MKNEKIIGSLISFIVAGLFYVLTLDFPTVGQTSDVGPAFMPRVYAGFLILFAFVLLFQGIKGASGQKADSAPLYQKMGLVAFIMILTVIYIFLIPYLGFYVVSFAFMILFLKITQVKNIWTLLLVPGGTALFVFVFFQKMLHVPVPTGILFS